jgi:hypothetical protein
VDLPTTGPATATSTTPYGWDQRRVALQTPAALALTMPSIYRSRRRLVRTQRTGRASRRAMRRSPHRMGTRRPGLSGPAVQRRFTQRDAGETAGNYRHSRKSWTEPAHGRRCTAFCPREFHGLCARRAFVSVRATTTRAASYLPRSTLPKGRRISSPPRDG